MRIATWNINGTKARIELLKRWLTEVQPDIVGLQELKMTDEQFPTKDLEALGYHALVHGQKSWNGVAILSREPAELVQRGLPGQEDFGSRLLTARVSGIEFTTIYCPNGKSREHDDFPKKLSWLDALAVYFEERSSRARPVVVCGDFNLVPAAIDSWNEQYLGGGIFHTQAERSRFTRLLDWGFHDLYRELHPDSPGFSWWDYRAGAFHKKQGLRIDFVLGTDAIRERLVEVTTERTWRKKIDDLVPSDHVPVWVDLS